jgi:hypothetical protein
MCAIEGHLSVIMIPHVNRQEVYAGDMKDSMYNNEKEEGIKQIRDSPVNFFIPNMKKYPHFGSTFRKQVNLEQADCVFIPAYFYFQI